MKFKYFRYRKHGYVQTLFFNFAINRHSAGIDVLQWGFWLFW